jgi:hypothetical protein
MIELIKQPWPWYVTGILIGLIVPLLLVLGNKRFGISSSLRHICAAWVPGNIEFFQYDWKKELWNLFFVAGIVAGGFIAAKYLSSPQPVNVSPALVAELKKFGIDDYSDIVPKQLFSFSALFSLRGVVMMVAGGFLVGFGTRYAGGCTSGHSIMGLSTMQWPSLIATVCFMVGGLVMSNLLLNYILAL